MRRFDRGFDGTWRRASYSSLTALAHEAPHASGVASETDVVATVDEDSDDEALVGGALTADGDDGSPDDAPAVPLATMPGGTRTGTLVHAVLEHTDFAAADLDAEVRAASGAERGSSALGIGPIDDVVDGLGLAIDTPLGPL